MKRMMFFLLVWCFGTLAYAQQSQTIYVDMKGTTTLLFPFQVDLVEIGNDKFIAEPNGKVVLIKAVKPSEELTNLLIRYGVDRYFTGFVGYKAKIEQRYYDFRVPLTPLQLDSLRAIKAEASLTVDENEVALQLFQHRPAKGAISLVNTTEDQINLSLLAVKNGPELTYLWLELHNQTSLPYHIRQINVQFRSKSRSRRLADQLIRRPLIAPQVPQTVEPYEKARIGFAIPHYASGKKSQLEVLIGEHSGNRVVMLKIKNTHIMNALLIETEKNNEVV